MAEMLALLPDPSSLTIKRGSGIGGFTEVYDPLPDAVEAAMPALREAAGNCPACIMAALRQRGIAVPMVESFDFKAESKKLFDENNSERAAMCGEVW
jgi:hypothetical protein